MVVTPARLRLGSPVESSTFSRRPALRGGTLRSCRPGIVPMYVSTSTGTACLCSSSMTKAAVSLSISILEKLICSPLPISTFSLAMVRIRKSLFICAFIVVSLARRGCVKMDFQHTGDARAQSFYFFLIYATCSLLLRVFVGFFPFDTTSFFRL